ncbi:MAG: S9 family peptidase [Flavobacteriales bacterium]
MNDGVHYSSLEYDQVEGSKIVKYAYATGKQVSTIATSKTIFGDASTSIDGYEFNADESKVLIQTATRSIYRHSFEANYYVYDLNTGKTAPLTDFDKGLQRLASFSPDGVHVSFVRANNVFVADMTNRSESQVTTDGRINEIINGYPDWVYEEEFGFHNGMAWSPEGNRLAFYRFDESNVREFQMAMYGPELYPDQYTFKYPKAGEENSKVSIWIHELDAQTTRKVDLGDMTDMYVPRIKWSNDNDGLCVMKMNRHQNNLEFHLTDLATRSPSAIPTTKIFTETARTYIDITDDLTFLGTDRFIWSSQQDGYNHLYLYDMQGNQVQQLTSGEWDVIEFKGIDQKKGIFYYTSSEEGAIEQNVYAKGIKKRYLKKLSTRPGHNDAVFSNTFAYYINYHSDANNPYYITLHDAKGKEIRVLKDNANLKKTVGKYNLTQKEFFTFKNRAGDDLNCWMIKPANFDPNKEYPVLVAIYGGPGHNTVTNSWGGSTMLWHHMLAQQGYIVASCDPRGTMYRGRDFMHSTYMQLGKLETEDFIDFAKHLGSENYIDAERIGMHGWSYGGYMTSLCMTKGADVYKAGIAVAPVTNWKYYDTIYTERFMRTPAENEDGYENNSPINHVDLLKGPFLLVHGSADDNVHYQNTMQMVDQLVYANKPFDLFIYPNKNHGIYGGPTRLHLFTKMTAFLNANL